MKLSHHTAYSLTISGMLYMMFKSWELTLSSFLAGIFIDLDHIYDYVREHGWSLNVRDFFRVNNTGQYDRVVLLWHAWEWLVLLAIISWATNWNPWITGILVGFTQHLVLDTARNGSNLWCYSLVWRWAKGFKFDIIFPRWKDIKYKQR